MAHLVPLIEPLFDQDRLSLLKNPSSSISFEYDLGEIPHRYPVGSGIFVGPLDFATLLTSLTALALLTQEGWWVKPVKGIYDAQFKVYYLSFPGESDEEHVDPWILGDFRERYCLEAFLKTFPFKPLLDEGLVELVPFRHDSGRLVYHWTPKPSSWVIRP